ncbi:hypothetical protein B0H13DRAFT_2340258 [Mycena leptocephala]|nr:hypothetical protein B0H13DRAFT_2340258 [Mycena leptocephala]
MDIIFLFVPSVRDVRAPLSPPRSLHLPPHRHHYCLPFPFSHSYTPSLLYLTNLLTDTDVLLLRILVDGTLYHAFARRSRRHPLVRLRRRMGTPEHDNRRSLSLSPEAYVCATYMRTRMSTKARRTCARVPQPRSDFGHAHGQEDPSADDDAS